MNTGAANALAASLLERGAAGYAGYAAAALLETHPALREQFAPDALGGWRQHLTQRVLELAAAVGTGEPQVFIARVGWAARSFRARGQDVASLRASLESLRDVLAERLPEAAREAPLDCLARALVALDAPPPAEETGLDPTRPTDRLALDYIGKVLAGDVAAAVQTVVSATRAGLDVRSAYIDVLLPAEREIGRLWHLGEVSVAEEHLVTSTTQRAMAVLASSSPAAAPNGRTAIVAAISSNAHDIGLRAVADLYQLAGWRALFLGADVPAEDVPAMVNWFQADLLLLGVTMATQLPRVTRLLEAVRERSGRPVKVIVGGAAFDEAPDVWRQCGADAYAARVDDVVALGERLVAG